MIDRLHLLDERIPIYFLHGGRSWIDIDSSIIAQSKRENVFVDTIQEAGHHVNNTKRILFLSFIFFILKVYADAPVEFDMYLKRILINKD